MRINFPHWVGVSCVRFLLPACFAFAFLFALAQDGRRQQGLSISAGGDSDGAHAFAFEVVSIRPSRAGDQEWRMVIDQNGDEYRLIGLPLGYTILFAYFPWALQRRERLSGAPAWIWKDKFDFVAKVAPEDIEEWHKSLRGGFGEPNPMLEAMLQAALADRCKLLVHRIPTTVPGFALLLRNRGPNSKRFSAARPNEMIPENAVTIPEGGRMIPILSPDEPILRFYKTSTTSLTAMMSRWGAPVEDHTGLTGNYDFALTRLSTADDPSVDWDLAALGLRLKQIRIPADDVVIDHIEYPSPN